MLTRCPACSTTFRIAPVQLKARAGTVRCGQCGFVFNALETLADDPASSSASAAAPSATPAADGELSLSESMGHDELEIVAPEISTGAADDETAGDYMESIREQAAPVADSPPEDYLAETLLHEPHAEPARRWPWVLGSSAAVLVLLLQAGYYYRVELAVLRPDLRPLLQAACRPLGCDVLRPRSIDSLGIDTSDLSPDPQQPGHLTLTAMLRSKAPYALEWPLLELTLTDVADRKLAVKHFAAGDYLPKDRNSGSIIAAGFPPNGEIAVALPLDVGDLPAAGYRLYVFYP